LIRSPHFFSFSLSAISDVKSEDLGIYPIIANRPARNVNMLSKITNVFDPYSPSTAARVRQLRSNRHLLTRDRRIIQTKSCVVDERHEFTGPEAQG